MDFDEYEYLENTLENSEKKRLPGKTNGDGATVEPEEKDSDGYRKYRDDGYGPDNSRHPAKRSRLGTEEDSKHVKDMGYHHSSSTRYKDMDKDKGGKGFRNRVKEEVSGMERNRNRDHDRKREREGKKEKIQNQDGRERHHEYEEGTGRERERERSRQSRSHSERQPVERERGISKDREHSAEKDSKERHIEEFIGRDRHLRKYRDKKEEIQAEADPERDQRTVFAYQISLKASERDVFEFFTKAGKVRDVQIIMDRNSRRPKGFGYVEFYDAMSVPMAIALSGQLLLGQPVMVKPSEAEKNLAQSTTASGGGGDLGQYSGGDRRLYVGNLPITIKENQIRQVFEAFGVVELVQMPVDLSTGNCKSYAFIQFARLEDAQAAQNLNGQLEIAGRVIKVSAITDQVGMQNLGPNVTDLDDDEGSGLSLNAHARALLMQKLDRTGSMLSPGLSTLSVQVPGQTSSSVLPSLTAADLSVPAVIDHSIDTVGVPSECLLLKNMFDPNSEVETDFDLDVKEDVQNECSKFGKLKHIYVDKNSAGFVYLKFENTETSIAAQRALHGRWFAGKMIIASFMFPHDYDAMFPDSM